MHRQKTNFTFKNHNKKSSGSKMFLTRILGYFKMNRGKKDSHFSNYHKAFDNMTLSSNNFESTPGAYDNIYEIINYWRSHRYKQINYLYTREASRSEKQEYAFADVLSSFSKNARDLNSFSTDSLHNLGITNWKSYSHSLISKGYIVRAGIIDTLISSYNVQGLKKIAEIYNVKKTGTKTEIAQRIANVLSSDEQISILNDKSLYIISEKGSSYLADNEDYVLFHKYYYLISLAEFNDNRIPKGGNHRRNFYDTMYQVLSNRKFFYEFNKDFVNVGSISLHIGNLMLEEYKNTTHNVRLEIALTNYVEYLYLCSCYCFHVDSALNYKIFPHTYNGFNLPNLASKLQPLTDFEPYIDYDFLLANKPPSFFTQVEFKQYIHEILTEPMFDYEKWDCLLQNRVKEFDKFIK